MADSRPWWLWPNLLSLDAPAVAVVWQIFLASVAGIEVPVAATTALALVVWGLYLGDRWLDTRGGDTPRTDRHRFAAAHPRGMGVSAGFVLSAAGAVAAAGLPESYLATGVVVATLSGVYFAAVHVVRTRRRTPPGLKEVSVGALFSAGVVIPLLADTPGSGWVPGVVAFGGLCGLNCLLIAGWEGDAATSPPVPLARAVGGAAAVAAAFATGPVAVAVLVSIGLLGVLDLGRNRLSRRAGRVLADAALLTPLVFALRR